MPFHFKSAVQTLPTGLVALELWSEVAPKLTPLSLFQRFPKLQVLRPLQGLADFDGGWDGEYPGERDEFDLKVLAFIVKNSCLAELHSLSIQDKFCCKLALGCSLSTSFPGMKQLAVYVRGHRHGLQLAASIAALPVTVLVLHILPGIKSASKLSITSDSLIKLLRVHVPETQPKVTLQLDKTRIDCILVHLQHSDRPIYSSASARRGVHVRMKAFDHLYAAFRMQSTGFASGGCESLCHQLTLCCCLENKLC